MSLEAMISGLSRDEKLAAMELIWQDLASDSPSYRSPDWHQGVITNRLERPVAGEALPMIEAKAEVKEAIHARRASR